MVAGYPEGVAVKRSAGVLLFRSRGDLTEVLLVHPGGPFWSKKDLGAWSIPKGEFDPGEDSRTCALRELDEELGAPPPLESKALIDLGAVRQKSGKVVDGWAAEADFDPATLKSNVFTMQWPPRSGIEREFPEVDRAQWFDLPSARKKLLPAQAAFLDRLVELLKGRHLR